METKASHVLIGAFTLAMIALAFLFVLWIAKSSLDREWDEYDIVFKEAVTGLSNGGAVQYNGIQVGEVRKLSLAPNDPRQVIARVRVAADTPIKTDTKAKLTFTGLTGVTFIQLSGGSPNAKSLKAQDGRAVPVIVADESALQKLLASSEDIVTSVNDLLFRVTKLLGQENLDKVATSLANIETLTTAVAARSPDIEIALKEIAQASQKLKHSMARGEVLVAKLTLMADRAQSIMDHDAKLMLATTRESLASAKKVADSAYEMIQRNQGAIENFSSQGLGQVGPVLVELKSTLRHLQKVTAKLERDPAAYLLGKQQPQEVPIR